MDIFQIVFISLIGVFLIQIVKGQASHMAILLTLVTSILILFSIIPNILVMKDIISNLSNYIDGDEMYIPIIFKIIGVAYVSEFASGICSDAGENAIASKVELAGKMIILVISSPIIFTLFEMIVTILP